MGMIERPIVVMALAALLCSAIAGSSALQVNETVKNFLISFDAKDDTNIIGKFWGGEEVFGAPPANIPKIKVEGFYAVIAGNLSDTDKRWGACFVLVFRNPVNASINDTERILRYNETADYVRVHDRVLDRHNAVFISTGESPEDPLMSYGGMYWLDEVNGKATKAVMVISQWPWNNGSERLFDTIHVEEIRQAHLQAT